MEQERAVRTRRALITSAAVVFGQAGYTRATLADISAGAGVSLGGLHFHFSNKAAVAQAVRSAATTTLGLAVDAVRGADTHAVQRLTDLTHTLALLLAADVVARAGLRLDRDDPDLTAGSLRGRWVSCVREFLSTARDRRELGAEVDVHDTSCTVIAATTGIALMIDAESAGYARTALQGLWRALYREILVPETMPLLDPAGTRSVIDQALAVAGGPAGWAPAARLVAARVRRTRADMP